MGDNSSFASNPSGSSNSSGCANVKCLFTNAERWAVVGSLLATFLGALIGNVIVCILIIKNRHLRNSTNYSIMNLSIADLLITVFCIPIVTVDLYITDEWIFGQASCKLVSFAQNLALVTSILNLAVISVEKFLMVWFPFFLRKKSKHIKWFLIATWIIGILQSSLTVNYRQVRVFSGKSYCMDNWPSFQSRRQYVIAHSAVFFFLPLLFMFVLHTLTITQIRSMKLPINSRAKRSTSNYVRENLKKSLSFNRKVTRKRKAINMLILIFFSFALCWSPYHIYQLWIQNTDLKQVSFRTVNIVFIVVLWMAFFSCVSHPIIYGLAGNKYRMAFRNSFSWRRIPDSTARSSVKQRSRESKK